MASYNMINTTCCEVSFCVILFLKSLMAIYKHTHENSPVTRGLQHKSNILLPLNAIAQDISHFINTKCMFDVQYVKC